MRGGVYYVGQVLIGKYVSGEGVSLSWDDGR